MRAPLSTFVVILALLAPPALAETAKPASEPEAPAAGDPAATPEVLGYIPVALNVAGVDYAGEVTPPEFEGPADLRLRRVDGATMADQGYLLAELGEEACRQAGFRYDEAAPPMLGKDGSWTVAGGCR